MSITIDLTPEQEALLSERAMRAGQEAGAYLLNAALHETEQEAWLRRLHRIGSPGAVLTEEATRRESIYED